MNTTRCYQTKNKRELLDSRLLKIEVDVEGKLYGNSGMGIRTPQLMYCGATSGSVFFYSVSVDTPY